MLPENSLLLEGQCDLLNAGVAVTRKKLPSAGELQYHALLCAGVAVARELPPAGELQYNMLCYVQELLLPENTHRLES